MDEKDRLIEEVSRLTAALEEMNFECQRQVIINSNLDYRLKESERELKQNISVLEDLELQNEKLKKQIEELKSGI